MAQSGQKWQEVCRSKQWSDWQGVSISRELFEGWLIFFRQEGSDLKKKWKTLTDNGIRVISYWSDEYPPWLREIHNPPVLLFYKGDIKCLQSKSLAIIGTR